MRTRTTRISLVIALFVAATAPAPAEGADLGKQMARRFFERRQTFEKRDGEVVLAQGGTPQVVIVAPADAPPALRFAAEELKTFLDRITGGDFRIVATAPADGRAIVLGDGPAARKAGIDVDALARDGYRIHCDGPTILIAGKDDATKKGELLFDIRDQKPLDDMSKYERSRRYGDSAWHFERGTLLGVYRFLEEMGCRWFYPGPVGEVVPSENDLSVGAFRLLHEPDYTLMWLGHPLWPPSRGGKDKSEYRAMGWTAKAHLMWLLRVRAASEWYAFNHRPHRACWEQRFGESHPEYFAMMENGKRDLKKNNYRKHTGHLCYTETGVFEETLEDAVAFFSGQPAASRGMPEERTKMYAENNGWETRAFFGDSISLLPGDGFPGCHTEGCLALTREDAGRSARYSNLIWPFVAKVGERLIDRFPDKFIICLAYDGYSEPPTSIDRLPGNVIVGLCPAKYNKTYNCISEEGYKAFFDICKQWDGMSDMPKLYWLHHLFRHKRPNHAGVPMQTLHFFKRFYTDLADHGRLMFMQVDGDSLMLEHLTRYVCFRLMNDLDTDLDALLDDYCESLYGPAADDIRFVMTDLEPRCEAIAVEEASYKDIWNKHFPAEVMESYRARADAALEKTKGTPREAAVRLFDEYYLGAMEKGRATFDLRMRKLEEGGGAVVVTKRAEAPVEIDGLLSEPGWQQAQSGKLVNNQNGKFPPWRTFVRTMRDDENVYVGFQCQDPQAAEVLKGGRPGDCLEVFFDPENDREDFYQVLIEPTGRIRNFLHDSDNMVVPDWESGAKVAFSSREDYWFCEIAIPRKNMENAMGKAGEKGWAANFCRTMRAVPGKKNIYCTWSPLVRGKFAQPDLFGVMVFQD